LIATIDGSPLGHHGAAHPSAGAGCSESIQFLSVKKMRVVGLLVVGRGDGKEEAAKSILKNETGQRADYLFKRFTNMP
jgi:hypothetical protein